MEFEGRCDKKSLPFSALHCRLTQGILLVCVRAGLLFKACLLQARITGVMQTPMKKIIFSVFLVIAAGGFASTARADFFQYTDDAGVVHITNVPTSKQYRWMMEERKPSVLSPSNPAYRKISKQKFDEMISSTATKYGIDPHLVRAIVKAESDYDEKAVSKKGATVVMLLSPGRSMSLVSAIIFVIVCATDWLDGYIARKKGIITSLGKFLDPLADKLLITAAFIMLIPLGRVPAWAVALIIGREIAVTGLRAIAVDSGVVIAASNLGKLKTIAQIVCLVPLIVHYPWGPVDFQAIGEVLLVAAFALTMWSGVDYFLGFFKAGASSEN